ncbi:MAG: hypothetical protein EAZ15_06275 [Sphingobacteriales bacterium]|nr:MAG: hypothetical protein EAZ15_06275 [Sphingobacteriales bacterium]
MKNLFKKAIIVASCTFVLGLKSFAQTGIENPKTDVTMNELNLSTEQKAMFKVSKEHRDAARKEFKESMSAQQKAIMIDKSLSKEEKRVKLAASLSVEQLQKQESNKAIAKENRNKFLNTLTPEQKKAFKLKSQNWKAKREANKADMKATTEDEIMFK